ncbi:MAG: purine-nucleoside phosphorylase [Firmicutes bacterium]|nr:purine-nucleoside phosphorylase [Bacillota bacterium]MBQ9604949.1 purine-nucleoside phosphorylase [Bacillota bacterium]
MENYTDYEKVQSALEYIRSRTDFVPKISVVLGSGLGALADEAEIEAIIEYKDIPHFPVSTVPGHKGRFVFGYIHGVPLVFMQGRVHYFEGYTMQQTVLPIRIMRALGSEILLLTNASGGVNTDFKAGDMMLMTDHIVSLVPSPLIGDNFPEGTRFPDMSNVYDKELSAKILSCADKLDIKLHQGVYIQLSGPNFETPAEVRMCRALGADAVGMSTASEAMAAVQCGFRVCGISCIANPAAGLSSKPLSHKDVQEAANKNGPRFRALIKECIKTF